MKNACNNRSILIRFVKAAGFRIKKTVAFGNGFQKKRDYYFFLPAFLEAFLSFFFPYTMAACAAANLAIGTRKGEQLT